MYTHCVNNPVICFWTLTFKDLHVKRAHVFDIYDIHDIRNTDTDIRNSTLTNRLSCHPWVDIFNISFELTPFLDCGQRASVQLVPENTVFYKFVAQVQLSASFHGAFADGQKTCMTWWQPRSRWWGECPGCCGNLQTNILRWKILI